MRTVVLPIESSRSSGRDLLRGVAKYSKLHGPWTFYWEPAGLDEVFPRLKDLNADGVIMRDSDRLEGILDLGLPVIVIGHYYDKIPGLVNVISDCRTIGRMAADHLARCGFHQFAYCGLPDKCWSNDRRDYFCERIHSLGFDVIVYSNPEEKSPLSWQMEQPHVVDWLRLLPKPVGLMTCNDDRSQQVVQACKIAGLKVPEEVAIIGVDNDELICDLSDPPLSSISLNFERAAYEGSAILDGMMEKRNALRDEIVIQATHVVARQSTDITAIENPDVAEAVSFIRKHANGNICVNDVVSVVPLSRRILEKLFRQYLNTSILQEIRRVRSQKIAQMLVETNLSVTQIALELGFQGDEHIARYFRKEMMMSPLQYRKKYGVK